MSLSGFCFAITGTLSVGRAEFEKLITSHGGSVAKSVTKSCTHLISAETGTKKCDDAKARGVQVVDEAWVRVRISGSVVSSDDIEKPPEKKPKVEPAPAAAAAPESSGPMNIWIQLDGKRATRVTLPAGSIVDDLKAAAKEKCAPILDAVATMDLCVFCGVDLCQEDEAVEKFLGYNAASTPLFIRVCTEEVSVKPVATASTSVSTNVPAAASAPAPAAAAAPSPSGVVSYLECQEGTSDKFYELSQAGSEVTIRYGRCGTPGVTQVKSFGIAEEANKFVSKTVSEKKKKGYRDAAGANNNAAPAPVTKAATAKSPVVSKALPPSPPTAKAVGPTPAGAGPLDGMCFAITGTLSVGRSEFEKTITNNGGKVAKSVTNSCTHLVSAVSGTKKCEDAEAKGVRVVDEDWVNARIAGCTDEGGGLGPGQFEPSGEFVKEMLGFDCCESEWDDLTKKMVGKRVYRKDDGLKAEHNCKITKFKTKDGEGLVTVKDYLEDEEYELDQDDFHDEWELYPSPEVANLFSKYMNRKISEGVWEEAADQAMIDRVNHLINTFAANEPVDIHPGTSDIVRDLVHPSLYPLLLPGGTDTSKRNFWGRRHEESKFQWLPTEFSVDTEGKATIASDINNLDTDKYPELRDSLADIFTALLPGFEKVWSYAKMLPYTAINEDDDDEDADYDSWADSYEDIQPVSFNGSNLQAVVKIADYTFAPGAEFEGVWHYEGMAHEDIVMTGLFYPKSNESLGGGLEFKRTFTNVETKEIFYEVPQSRAGWLEELISDGFVPLGKTTTETGKLLVFPNSHAHRVAKMVNPTTETITRRLVVFFFINPEARIPSSRDHPPMPRTISLDEALANRLELMRERKFAKEKLNPRVIELCEH